MLDTCKRHVRGDLCDDCGYGHEVFGAFTGWFRTLSKGAQWLVGLPIIVLSTLVYWGEVTHVPEPGEPLKAFWVQLILLVVAIVLTELLRPKPNIENARPSVLGDFTFPTATEGRPVPLIWGKIRQRGPNVVWYGDLSTEAITEKVKTGLWSSETITIGFRYKVGVQMAICRGGDSTNPVTCHGVWVGDDKVLDAIALSTPTIASYDNPMQYGGNKNGNGGLSFTMDYFPGNPNQVVSTYLDDPSRQRLVGASTIPRYQGTCYVVARENTGTTATVDDKGFYVGNSSSIVKPWSFEVSRYPALFQGQSGGDNSIGVDANPINVIYEILTNTEWGMGIAGANIDTNGAATASFNLASITCQAEGLGFSMMLDGQRPAKDMLEEVKRHVDGNVYIDHSTGKWTIQLAREAGHAQFGYDINTVPQFTDSNVAEVRDFTRAAWVDTTNTITTKFDKRIDDYKESFAVAQDMANAMIQGDGTVPGAQSISGGVTFPGVKDVAVASKFAWREVRGQSYPLARVSFVVNRQMWDLSVGDVIAWTSTQFGFVKLGMRVTEINYGRLEDNKMTVTAVQDVFSSAVASYGSPSGTGWTPPTHSAGVYTATEQIGFESPRGIVVRDPKYGGNENVSKVWCGGIDDGNTGFLITQRNATGEPGGTYADDNTSFSFMRIGELNAALNAGETNQGTKTITIEPSDSNQTELESAFDDNTTEADMGADLAQLVYIANNDENGEFILVRSASINGANVDLENVWRGVLDTPMMDHPANRDVYLVFVGGALTDTNFPTTNQVDIQLEQVTAYAQGSPGPEIDLQMAQRSIRPYAPGQVFYNSVAQTIANGYNTPDLEDNGTGENGQQFAVDWWRRRYDNTDEVAAMKGDVDPDGPSTISNTEYQVRVFVDPDGGNTEIASSPLGWASGAGTVQVPRLEIIDAMTADDQDILVEIEARHDYAPTSATQLRGRYDMTHQVNPTTVNDGLFFLGGNIGNAASNAYTVPVGDNGEAHTIRIGAVMTLATAQYRINGGSWVNIVGTSATTAALSTNDTIEVQVTSSSYAPDPNFVEIEEGSATRVAYGTL